MKPNMLTHLATASVRTSTYLRAWYIVRAKEVMRGQCCGSPMCGRVAVLVHWWEWRAGAPWQA